MSKLLTIIILSLFVISGLLAGCSAVRDNAPMGFRDMPGTYHDPRPIDKDINDVYDRAEYKNARNFYGD